MEKNIFVSDNLIFSRCQVKLIFTQFIKAYTDNVSGGGLFIRTANPFEVGRRFPLELQIPGIQESLRTMCQVVWTRKQAEETKDKPAGMGVKFSEMNKKDHQTLKQYIENAKKK